MSDSASHATVQRLTEILEPLRMKLRAHCMKDSFTFVERIKGHDPTDKNVLSVDLASLFTSVPLIEMVGCVPVLDLERYQFWDP